MYLNLMEYVLDAVIVIKYCPSSLLIERSRIIYT